METSQRIHQANNYDTFNTGQEHVTFSEQIHYNDMYNTHYQYQQFHSSPEQVPSYTVYQDLSSPMINTSSQPVYFAPLPPLEPLTIRESSFDSSDNEPRMHSFDNNNFQFYHQQPQIQAFEVDPFNDEPVANIHAHHIPEPHDTFNTFPNISTDLSEEPPFEPQVTVYPTPQERNFPAYVKYPGSSAPSSTTDTVMPQNYLSTPATSPSTLTTAIQHHQPAQDHNEHFVPLKRGSLSSNYRASESDLYNHRIAKPSMANGRLGNYQRARSVPNIPSNRLINKIGLHTTQPGPIPASRPEVQINPSTGDELLTFSYSKQKIIKIFKINCPPVPLDTNSLPESFLLKNCVYPRAMVPIEEYKGNRGKYERECNEIGWTLSWLNPEIRNHRGIIQRAVDSWRNTRSDKKLRSRRVRKTEIKSNN